MRHSSRSAGGGMNGTLSPGSSPRHSERSPTLLGELLSRIQSSAANGAFSQLRVVKLVYSVAIRV